MPDKLYRPIRSFVRREGRLTQGQQRALDALWPRFGIDGGDSPLDLGSLFGRDAPKVLEIGFGNGASLAQMATEHPENDYLGIEVHRPGMGNLLRLLEERDLHNVRVIRDDAMPILTHRTSDASFEQVQLFFPDPWHKRRHHKRRIVQPAFVALIAAKLQPGGIFHLATDWEHYAKQMMIMLSAADIFYNLAGPRCFSPRPEWRPLTKFEQRGQRLGHGVWDLLFKRRD
jgi:tRNA (guanine-N7-)-methyltransferase